MNLFPSQDEVRDRASWLMPEDSGLDMAGAGGGYGVDDSASDAEYEDMSSPDAASSYSYPARTVRDEREARVAARARLHSSRRSLDKVDAKGKGVWEPLRGPRLQATEDDDFGLADLELDDADDTAILEVLFDGFEKQSARSVTMEMDRAGRWRMRLE